MMMIRALSTRKKDQGGYKKLGEEEAADVELLKGKPQSVPASSHGKSPESSLGTWSMSKKEEFGIPLQMDLPYITDRSMS
ncbi:unnamed protein product [Arabis nemorensis]|uniref:Uncharacterized protein n=1 Tax=Arabis nemorensis TaxID=586526 RepID=A0A565CXF9_9BRAS|nr:unnamed protein product [Arabis nemorensis]